MRQARVQNTIRISVAAILVPLFIVPFYVLVVLATNPASFSVRKGDAFAPHLYLDNFTEAWKTAHLGTALTNSAIITACALVLLIASASAAAYIISRWRNRFTSAVYWVFLCSMMIPPIINTVPLYSVMKSINAINSYWGMVLLMCCNCLPFTLFLYTSFLRSVPQEFDEAARIDGCNNLQTFTQVIFPLLLPVTGTAVILQSVSIWNNYNQAVFFLQSRDMLTMPLAISMFYQTYGAKWNLMAAASFICMVPMLVLFLVFQKNFVSGLATGGLKT